MTDDSGLRFHHGKWQVRYYDRGARRSATFVRKTDAKAFRDGARVDKHRGVWIDPARGRTPFDEYAEGWFGSITHLQPSTREKVAGHLRTHILPTFASLSVGEIEPADVRAWVSRMVASGRAPGTVIAAYRTFSRIMKTAVIEGLIARSPCIGIDLPRDRRAEMLFLSAEEVAALADAIEDRYAALIFTAAFSGARWGELAALKVERLNLLRGTLEIRESLSEVNGHLSVGPTKTGTSRAVSLPAFLRDMLGEHLARFPSPEGFVFSSAEGGPLRRTFYRRHYRPAVARARLADGTGLPEGLRFHDLRHTCVALLIAQGAHAKEIAERLGHSTVRLTLDRYAHLLPSLDERLREGLEGAYQEALAASNGDQMGTRRGPTPLRTLARESV
jgi:integrase